MNLFEKIDLFYKKAQELKTDPGGMSAGTEDKSVPVGGYPHQSIRAVAKDALSKLMANTSIPKTVKTTPNSLGDLLGDFLGGRFADKDLDYHWDSYLAAIMDKINKAKLEAANKDLSVFYQSIFNNFSSNWDAISKAGWTAKVAKPTASVWMAMPEDPWNDYSDPFNNYDPKTDQYREDQVNNPMPPLKTSRLDRMKKIARLLKR